MPKKRYKILESDDLTITVLHDSGVRTKTMIVDSVLGTSFTGLSQKQLENMIQALEGIPD